MTSRERPASCASRAARVRVTLCCFESRVRAPRGGYSDSTGDGARHPNSTTTITCRSWPGTTDQQTGTQERATGSKWVRKWSAPYRLQNSGNATARNGAQMAFGNLKTGVRKDLGVRIPRLPTAATAKRLSRAFDPRRSSPPWTELAASGAATIALFLTALVSMTSFSSTGRSQPDESRTRTEVTFLSPPPTPAPPREKPVRPRATVREPVPTPPQVAAAGRPYSSAIDITRRYGDSPRTPAGSPDRHHGSERPHRAFDRMLPPPARDSDRPRRPRASPTIRAAARGAATMTSHDSAFAAWAAAAHEIQRWSTMSPGAKTEVAESTELITKLSQRVGTAGNSGDVHVMTGQGKDGVGAAGGPGDREHRRSTFLARTLARTTNARLGDRRRDPRRARSIRGADRRETRFRSCRLASGRLASQSRSGAQAVEPAVHRSGPVHRSTGPPVHRSTGPP